MGGGGRGSDLSSVDRGWGGGGVVIRLALRG